jgi:hypothetical protein
MTHQQNHPGLMDHQYTDRRGEQQHSALPEDTNHNSLYSNFGHPNWDDGEARFELNSNYNTSDFMKRKWDNFIDDHRENIRYITKYEGNLTMSNVRIVNGPVSENGRFYIYFEDI